MNSGNSISNFTKQSGGLPTGLVKLPRGSGQSHSFGKHIGGLGGSAMYKSYPKWVRDEIHDSEKSKQSRGIYVGYDSEFEDSDDDLPAPPKTEQEAEKQQERKLTRELNNEIAREEGFSGSEHSEGSDPEHLESVLTKIHDQDGNETDNSVDLEEPNEKSRPAI